MQSYTSIYNWKRATPVQILTLTESLLWRFTNRCDVNIYPSELAVRHQWVSDTVIPYIEAVLPENIHPNQRNSQKYPATGPNKYWKNSPKSKIYWVAGTFVGDFDVPNLCCCRHHSLCQVPRIMEDRRLILREKSNISMETYTKTDFVLNKVNSWTKPLCFGSINLKFTFV